MLLGAVSIRANRQKDVSRPGRRCRSAKKGRFCSAHLLERRALFGVVVVTGRNFVALVTCGPSTRDTGDGCGTGKKNTARTGQHGAPQNNNGIDGW